MALLYKIIRFNNLFLVFFFYSNTVHFIINS